MDTIIDTTDASTGRPMTFSADRFTHLSKDPDNLDITFINLDNGVILKTRDSIKTLTARIGLLQERYKMPPDAEAILNHIRERQLEERDRIVDLKVEIDKHISEYGRKSCDWLIDKEQSLARARSAFDLCMDVLRKFSEYE